MKILCAYSGVEFTVQHFSANLYKNESCHPIFALQPKDLLGKIYPQWIGRRLNDEESRLLFVALLHSSGNVLFNCAAVPTAVTVENYMERLARMIGWIDIIKVPSLVLTKFSVNPSTRFLENIHHWMEVWERNRDDFNDAYKSQSLLSAQSRREEALERLIKNFNNTPERYAHSLAEWASIAGNFPKTTQDINGTQIPLNEYWKSIIRNCGRADLSLLQINYNDLIELIKECEDTIPHGSIYAAKLMQLLRNTAKRIGNTLGFSHEYLGDDDEVGSKKKIAAPFVIVDSVEEASLAALAINAPTDEPKRTDYDTSVAYTLAMIKYRHRMRALASQTLGSIE